MRTGSLIALGLSAGVITLVAFTRRAPGALPPAPTPPNPSPPTPPNPQPRMVKARTIRATVVKAQPDDLAVAVGTLPAGAVIDVEASVAPGWLVMDFVKPGLPPVDGYVKVSDITSLRTGPEEAISRQLTAFSSRQEREQDSSTGLLYIPRALPADVIAPRNTPLPYESYRPGRVITDAPDPTRFLTGESLQGESSGDEVARVLRTVEAPFKALSDYYANDWYPKHIGTSRPDIPRTLRNVSQFRSFWDQANIVLGVVGSPKSDEDLRSAFRYSLTTRSIPGFSRHHWGTEIDVVAADSSAWARGGPLEVLWPFVHDEAPKFGFYTPFREGFFPEPTKAHYQGEPWHLSYFPVAAALRERWLSEVEVASLLTRVAATLSPRLGISADRIFAVLSTLDLPSYQRNVAPAPVSTTADSGAPGSESAFADTGATGQLYVPRPPPRLDITEPFVPAEVACDAFCVLYKEPRVGPDYFEWGEGGRFTVLEARGGAPSRTNLSGIWYRVIPQKLLRGSQIQGWVPADRVYRVGPAPAPPSPSGEPA